MVQQDGMGTMPRVMDTPATPGTTKRNTMGNMEDPGVTHRAAVLGLPTMARASPVANTMAAKTTLHQRHEAQWWSFETGSFIVGSAVSAASCSCDTTTTTTIQSTPSTCIVTATITRDSFDHPQTLLHQPLVLLKTRTPVPTETNSW